jgi:hypothetical protein
LRSETWYVDVCQNVADGERTSLVGIQRHSTGSRVTAVVQWSIPPTVSASHSARNPSRRAKRRGKKWHEKVGDFRMVYPARHIRFVAKCGKCGQDVVAMDTLTSDGKVGSIFYGGVVSVYATVVMVANAKPN